MAVVSRKTVASWGLAVMGGLVVSGSLPTGRVAQGAPAAPASLQSAALAKKEALASVHGAQQIENAGFPDAIYYKPRAGKAMKPVFVYMHGRGSEPAEHCRAWAKVVTEFGWLLCVVGQQPYEKGGRWWASDPITSQKNVMGALNSLRKKYGRRVQLYGNVLIGFSEGAVMAQYIGPRDPKTFNRWLILSAYDRYFGDANALKENAKKVKRVYLWTGELDGGVPETKKAFERLRSEGVEVKLNVPKGFEHKIPHETMGQNFRKALRWLVTPK